MQVHAFSKSFEISSIFCQIAATFPRLPFSILTIAKLRPGLETRRKLCLKILRYDIRTTINKVRKKLQLLKNGGYQFANRLQHVST
jgi:hypothetical protein